MIDTAHAPLEPVDAEPPPEGDPAIGGYGAYSVAQIEGNRDLYHDEDIHRFADSPLPVLSTS